MSLRLKFTIYLIAVHAALGALAFALARENRFLLLTLELLLVVSIVVGVRLLRAFLGTLDLLRAGAAFIAESDFNSRFRPVGQRETDSLVAVYNRMADHLREERIRLEEQHYLLDKVLRASPSGVVTLDYDGHVSFVNPAAERLLCVDASELEGRPLGEIGGQLASELTRLTPGESRIAHVGGGRRLKCHKSRFVDRGFPRDFVVIDELTEELRQSEKAAYEKLIRMIAHEVNNSAGAAGSLIESCRSYAAQLRPEDKTDYEEALAVIASRMRQLGTFIRGFADVVRLPAPDRRPCDPREVVRDVVTVMRAELERRRIAWRTEEEGETELVSMDRAQMEQVFVNVVKNAAEAIGEGGTITARFGRRGGRSFAAIEDSGPGLSDDARRNLFAPFFSTKEDGRGIGLTLVAEILTHHGFDFTLDGPPGGPTRFTILFDG